MEHRLIEEYEKYHNIKITAKNIEDIVKYSEMYIHDKCNPDKSIELSLKGSDVEHLYKFNKFTKHNKNNVKLGENGIPDIF